MNEILSAICFLMILIIFMIIVIYFTLKKDSDDVYTSKYILNRFKPNNTAPNLTEMIEFHKNNDKLSKYNIE